MTPNIECAHDEIVKISDLKLNPKNANHHPKEQIERLAKILKYQGFRQPIIVSNRSKLVCAGHGRIEAAKLNGWTEVPVSFQNFQSDDQETAFLHADNAIALWADLDISAISEDLINMDVHFDLDMLGIEGFNLDVADEPIGSDPDEESEKNQKSCPQCGFKSQS